jgi:hypothetical protein
MKNIKLFSFVFLFMVSNSMIFGQTNTATPKSNKKDKTVLKTKPEVLLKFDTEKLNIGRIKKGASKTFKYNFENAGSETIEIETVSSCDCTTIDWPRGPINPGEKRILDVKFDSTEKELKEKSVDIDIYLKNKDKKTGSSIFKIISYQFDLFL